MYERTNNTSNRYYVEKMWKFAHFCVMKKRVCMLWITSSRRWITSSSRGKADKMSLLDFVSLCRSISRREIPAEIVAARREKSAAALRDAKNNAFPFFFFLAVRRIYGLVGRNLAVALTPLSRGPLYTLIYIRTKALQLASRMLPASFFVLARGIMGGTFARWCAHICRIVNIYEVYGGGEGGRMKNHWQISDGLCASPRSREFIGNASYDCWRRTFAEQRDGHLRPCISPSSVLYEIWNR